MASARNFIARSKAIVLPSVRTYRIWTPGQLRAAEASADTGYIRNAVDICEWLLGDDKVRGALDGRVGAFLNLPLSFDPSQNKRKNKKLVKFLEGEEDWWAMFADPEVRMMLYWGLLLNFGPGVAKWQRVPGHGDRDIPVVKFFHPQPFTYDWHRRVWRRNVDGAASEEVQFGDGVWIAHSPFGTYRPWAMGFWRGLAPWKLLKAYAINDMGRLGETVTRSVVESDIEDAPADLVGDVEETKELREELSNKIATMGRDGTLILPPGYSYKLVETSRGTAELFKQQIQMADNAIAINIRGGNLSTDVQGGSRAAAEVQERTGDLQNRRDDAGNWATTAHDQVLKPWSASNFGDSLLAPWPAYATEPEEDKKFRAETMVEALEGAKAAVELGFELDHKAFADEFGLSSFLAPPQEPKAGNKRLEDNADRGRLQTPEEGTG